MGGMLSRAEVVALGRGDGEQGVDAWAFVPVALGALRVEPRDGEVRLLLSAAYGRLGLKSAALEQIGVLRTAGSGAGSDGAAEVGALAGAIEQLPDDRIPVAELGAVCAANVEALAERARHAVDLRGRLNAWKMLATTQEWFRARDGNVVRRKRGDTGAWTLWGDHAGMAGRAGGGGGGAGNIGGPAPSVVEGMDPPALLKRVVEQTAPTGNGYLPPVTMIELDEMRVLNGLAQMDLRAALGEERVRLVVGKAAAETWARELEERAMDGLAVTGPIYTLPDVSERGATCAETILTHVVARQGELLRTLNAEVRSVYFARDRERLGARFGAALAGKNEPLRVLIPTCRYSTFIRHSAADLAEAFESIGCRARVLIEPDAHAQLTNVAHLRSIAEFRPDLVVQINYARANLGEVYPPGLVYATWVQDAMPHLFDARIGAAQGRTDFLTGNLTERFFQSFKYPRARAMHAPMAASTRKFHEGVVTDAQRERFACEIAYVSHHSETPGAMLERLVAESAGARWMGEVAREVFPRVQALIGEELKTACVSLSSRLRDITSDALRSRGAATNEHVITQILTRCTHPLADRMLRHQTLEWAAAAGARRGWRMHLYGKGWEGHPTLGGHARGELEHGDDLRACYRLARAHLQISAHTVIHQRVFECALSGGLPLCRLQADDLTTMQFSAAAEICRDTEPSASDPWTTLGFGYRRAGYPAAEHDAGRAFNAFLRRVGLEEAEFVWINPILLDRIARLGSVEGEAFAPARLLGDPGALMFHTEKGLERLLERAVHDDAERERTRSALLSAARGVVTTDAFAGRMVRFITDSLARAEEGDGREWFDGETQTDGVRPGMLTRPDARRGGHTRGAGKE